MPELRIGTSGWHYKHWLDVFYPAKLPASRMLEFYARRFDTVEVNNSFYRLPAENAVNAWRDESPRNFLFAVKGSRYLTHMKKLRDASQGIQRFLDRAEILGRKLGPILFQLPPHWTANPERLNDFLNALPTAHRYAFEFRESSWNCEEVFQVLRAHRAAYCVFDMDGHETPLTITANFIYVRLHGPGARYRNSYSDEMLAMWAERIARWRGERKDVYIYILTMTSADTPCGTR